MLGAPEAFFPRPNREGHLDSTSSSTCPLHPKVKRSRYKTGDGVISPPPAPNLPAKPLLCPPGPDSPAAVVRLQKGHRAALHPAMRLAAGREPLRGRRRGARARSRTRAPRASSSRARATLGLQQLLARFRASTGPRLLHSREGRPGRPYTLQELSGGAKFQTWAGSGCGQALRADRSKSRTWRKRSGYGVWYQQSSEPQLPNL